VYVYDRVIPDLKGRPKGNKCQLTWTKTGDYAIVMRSQISGDRGFEEVGRTDSSYATFLDTNIEYNVEYYYRVYACVNGRPDPFGVSDAEFVVSFPRNFDERPPQFQSTPLRVAQVGQLYSVMLDVRNPVNEPLYFSVLAGPANLSVNLTNGNVLYVPTADQIGNQPVSFQVTNDYGRDVLSYTLFVFPASNHPPVAVVNGPYAALTGQDIQFSSAGTRDPDNNPLRYYWNFGDGSTSTNPNPVHAYGGIGDYLVSLFVNDGYGGTTSAQTYAQITRPNVPPVAIVSNGPSFTVRLGETLVLDGSPSYSPLGNPLTYNWLWGDGAVSNNAPSIVSHRYGAGGPYPGGLIVADNRGGSNTCNFQVTVGPSNRPPIIAMTVSTSTPYVESTVTFDATASTDPEGDPMTFAWDFGDRSKTTGPLVTHVFHQISDFTVTLTVADNHGGVTTATQLIHALNAPPVFTSNPPLLTRAGTNCTYTPAITDADGDSSTFELITGPVTMSCDTNSGTLNWLPGTNNIGPNSIVLRATDANGASTDQSFTLVVSTALGPQLDLEPTHIEMTNVMVDSQTLALSGTVRVYLRNNGSDPVPVPFTVSVFVDADFDDAFSTNADYVVGYGVFPAGFPGDGSGYIDMTVNGQALFKDCPLDAFVDSQNVVPEYNKLNNIMRSGSDAPTNTPPVIDLSASLLQVGRLSLPTNALLTARLGNSGLVPVPTNVPMAFYDGNPTAGGQLIGVAHSTAVLSPGMYQDLRVTWAAPTITTHTVFVVADDPGTGTNLFQEITLSNNTFSVVVDLSAILLPIADAGPNQNVNAGDTVGLNGRGSFDPQGRPLTYRWSMLSIPIGSRAQLTGTNTVSPSFVTDVGGLYSAQLVVNDGIVDSTNFANVSIAAIDTNVFYPPTITSRPSFQGMVSVLYTYPVTATDPQSKPLSFRLPQAPAGMTINTNTGLVSWTPANTGSFFVQVAADGVGGSSYQGYTLTVVAYQNLPPQFTSTPVTTAAPNTAYTYNAVAVDPNRDTVSYSLTQKPSGMSINSQSGVITWTPAASQLGGRLVTVMASDGKGGIATQPFNLVVLTTDTNGPVVQPIPDQTVTAPAAFATLSLDSYVSDPNYPRNQITWTATGTNQLSVIIDSNRVATVLYPQGVNVAEQITFLATDPAGKS
ncbi:MAG: PKD domain-containing protein, partial [Verrucomicrobiota bacterium]